MALYFEYRINKKPIPFLVILPTGYDDIFQVGVEKT